jgi:hypothetical protein
VPRFIPTAAKKDSEGFGNFCSAQQVYRCVKRARIPRQAGGAPACGAMRQLASKANARFDLVLDEICAEVTPARLRG